MTAIEFNQCLKMISNGNKQGMEILYNNFYRRFVVSLFFDGKSKEDAEDIASNALISIYRNAANYKYIENPQAWMMQTLKYALLNFKKKNAKYAFTDKIDNTYCAESRNTEFELELKRQVEKLTERQQEIFKLHYVFDFEIKDTAKQLKISKSTVNRELIEIKEKLKDLEKILKNF